MYQNRRKEHTGSMESVTQAEKAVCVALLSSLGKTMRPLVPGGDKQLLNVFRGSLKITLVKSDRKSAGTGNSPLVFYITREESKK